jgi:HME family heavy-metal exporter
VTIFGGLIGATALDAFITPILLLRFGRAAVERLRESSKPKPQAEGVSPSAAQSY